MPLQDYPHFEFSPRKLSKEEIEDPFIIIHGLFDFAHLPQIREMLWSFLKVAVSGTWNTLSSYDRLDLLYFFEKIEKIIEANHVLIEQKKNHQIASNKVK